MVFRSRSPLTTVLTTLSLGLIVSLAPATVVELNNGTEFKGLTDAIPTLSASALAPAVTSGKVDVELIVVIDDGLRRTFVSRYQVVNVRDEIESPEKIRLNQNVVKEGTVLGRVGDIIEVTPFDKHGRRRITTLSAKGPIRVIQGITEITPIWTRVRGLKSAKSYVWDMRIATSSIPHDKLKEILTTQLNRDDPQARLSVALLYLQAQRYRDAESELRAAIDQFPELNDLKDKLTELRQLRAKQQLDEIKLRQAAGQHKMTADLLSRFPADDVAGEILLEVSELAEHYKQQKAAAVTSLDEIAAAIDGIKQKPVKRTLQAFHRELSAELNFNSLRRLADYQRLAGDPDLSSEQKLALALSGWLLDGNGIDNLSVATSLWETRRLVGEYLVCDDATRRTAIIGELASQDGGAPRYIAMILAAMKPPLRTARLNDRWVDPPADETAAAPPSGTKTIPSPTEPAADAPSTDENPAKDAGMFHLSTSGLEGDPDIEYVVQLPPEYDANRRYPTIVALHPAGAEPEMEIDWWAGVYRPDLRLRLGQAARHGYIVIAPKWTKPKQRQYGYTANEHAAVLYSLRDAMRRFSVDSDRVFLTGHTRGADAAWDIALAHPDLWAGVIPICGIAEYTRDDSPKYVTRYWENAKHVSFYFVGGAMDGNKIDVNSRDWNRYLRHAGYDTTIVEYLGRGEEHFYDEIQRIFAWMDVHQRNFATTDFEIRTMRPWDRFFWWLEIDEIPARSMIHPAAWPARKGLRPTTTEGHIRDRKNVTIKTASGKVTAWLSPDVVDMDANIKVYVNSRLKRPDVTPSAEVLLEDARTRCDRQHPFWVKLDLSTGRTPNN